MIIQNFTARVGVPTEYKLPFLQGKHAKAKLSKEDTYMKLGLQHGSMGTESHEPDQ